MISDMEILIGKIVKDVKLEYEKYNNHITFITDKEEYDFKCYAQCCSDTWIESVEGIENLIEEEVISTDWKLAQDLSYMEIDVYKEENKDFCANLATTAISVYGVDIITKKGICTIDFRNASNGYYGGSLDLVGHEDELKQLKR